MDFRNREYFVIGGMYDYRFDHQIVKKIKRYFSCKINCKYIYVDNKLYNYCIGINNINSKKLINFFEDNNIKYIKVKKEPFVLTYYMIAFINNLETLPSWYNKLSEVKKEEFNKLIDINYHKHGWKTPAMRLLDELTK